MKNTVLWLVVMLVIVILLVTVILPNVLRSSSTSENTGLNTILNPKVTGTLTATPLVSPEPTDSTTGLEQAGVLYVVIEGGKFVPGTLTVPSETTITWLNKDATPHQIISGPYLQNSELPDLDSGEIEAQGVYSYTFSRVGTWSYYDKLNPQITGRVIVQ